MMIRANLFSNVHLQFLWIILLAAQGDKMFGYYETIAGGAGGKLNQLTIIQQVLRFRY